MLSAVCPPGLTQLSGSASGSVQFNEVIDCVPSVCLVGTGNVALFCIKLSPAFGPLSAEFRGSLGSFSGDPGSRFHYVVMYDTSLTVQASKIAGPELSFELCLLLAAV